MQSFIIELSNFFFFALLFRATLVAYGIFLARDQIRATAAGHGHSSAGSEPRLQPTQLMATPAPLTH